MHAAEFLGLTPQDRAIVTNSTDNTLHSLWGFETEEALNSFVSNRNAGQILKRSGLGYEDFASLLKVPFIRSNRNLEINFETSSCDLDDATILDLDLGVLERLRKFVVLWNKVIWSIDETGLYPIYSVRKPRRKRSKRRSVNSVSQHWKARDFH